MKGLLAKLRCRLAQIAHVAEAMAWSRAYVLCVAALVPFHLVTALLLGWRVRERSVVHIGQLRHLEYDTVQALRMHGIAATFVAVGPLGHWQKCDLHLPHRRNPVAAALRDSIVFWTTIAPHAAVHAHAMMGISHFQWEFVLLRLLRRTVVAHFRGCEARSRRQNLDHYGGGGICRDCDYLPTPLCEARENRRRRWAASHLAHHVLVTTPDMRDFFPQAIHLPFLPPARLPEVLPREPWTPAAGRPLRIVHVTNQPGIEGTYAIRRTIAALVREGRSIEFEHICGVDHEAVLQAYATADLAIGKMLMGYYANAQIEAMSLGLPTITWVRDDLRHPGLEGGGLIICSLAQLGEVLADLMDHHPEQLHQAAAAARMTVAALHDSAAIVARLRDCYGF